MAPVHGKKSSFKVDNAAGVLKDLTRWCDDIGFPRPVDTADTSTMGQDSKTYIVGLKDGKITIKGVYDAASADTPDPILSGIHGQEDPVTFEYQAKSGAASSSNPKYTGDCLCTSYEITSSVGDKVAFSAEFQITGDVSRVTS